jgi:hypothetical protein
LTGGGDSDIFVLGDSTSVYYDGDYNNGFALITDSSLADTIILKGKDKDYYFDNQRDAVLNPGLYIYRDYVNTVTGKTGTLGAEDDLIALVAGASASFTYKFV